MIPTPKHLLRLQRCLEEMHIEGIPTNQYFLLELIKLNEVIENSLDTQFISRNLGKICHLAAEKASSSALPQPTTEIHSQPKNKLNALLVPEDCIALRSAADGTLVEWKVQKNQKVYAGEILASIESMKMHFPLKSPCSGSIEICEALELGNLVQKDQILVAIRPDNTETVDGGQSKKIDPNLIRNDLKESLNRHAELEDSFRQEAVSKRHKKGYRTARENIYQLLDPDSFIEYGALVVAAQRKKYDEKTLREKSPGDGIVIGLGSINQEIFSTQDCRCAVFAYDYTVMAGTQGAMNHKKTDRLLDVVNQWRIPVVLFAEGGGGRPGDTDAASIAGLDLHTFQRIAQISGLAPSVGIVNGYCFAGNAAVLGVMDVIIATESSNIGMAGPAMIEGGGLGIFAPTDIGPVSVQANNGVLILS